MYAQCRNNIALMRVLGKIQLSTSEFCSVQVQPDVRVSMDGTFCEPSQGVERGMLRGCSTNVVNSSMDTMTMNSMETQRSI